MKKKRIGFDSYGDEDPEEKDNVNKSVEQIKTFLQAIYSNDGTTEQKEFRTTRDLIYELRDMITAGFKDMNEALSDLGYELEYLEGVPHWILYERTPNP